MAIVAAAAISKLRAPFPYYGGKRAVAATVWERFGNVEHYVEPFFGSGAVLLARPNDHDWASRKETVNDLDGYVANFWRAVKADPEAVVEYADWPINECDLRARSYYLLVNEGDLAARVMGDPEYYDAKVAGYWVYAVSTSMSGTPYLVGPHAVVDGKMQYCGRRSGIAGVPPQLSFHMGIHAWPSATTMYMHPTQTLPQKSASGVWSMGTTRSYALHSAATLVKGTKC